VSTRDQLRASQHRDASKVGSPTAVAGIVIGLVLIAAGAAVQVRALFSVAELDTARDLSELSLPVFGLVIGVPLLLAGFFVHIAANLRFPGKLTRTPGIGRAAVLFIGLSTGAWWGLASVPSSRALWLIPVAVTVPAVLLLVREVRTRRRPR
jgi:hypothetical protein